MGRTSSAVCGTICGCRDARDPLSSQLVRVKWNMRRLSVLYNTPLPLFSPKPPRVQKILLARSLEREFDRGFSDDAGLVRSVQAPI